jgi:hypothetical protein
MEAVIDNIVSLFKKARKLFRKKEAKYLWVGFGKDPLQK